MLTAPFPEDPRGDSVVDGSLPHDPRRSCFALRRTIDYRLMNTFTILCAILRRELNAPDLRSRATSGCSDLMPSSAAPDAFFYLARLSQALIARP